MCICICSMAENAFARWLILSKNGKVLEKQYFIIFFLNVLI